MSGKKNWRMSVSMTKEMEDAIVQLRKDERFTRLTYSEILRMLIGAGLESIGVTEQTA